MSDLVPNSMITPTPKKEISVKDRLAAVKRVYDAAIGGDWAENIPHNKIELPVKAANQAQITAVKWNRVADITADSSDEDRLKVQIVRMKAAVAKRVEIQPDWVDEGTTIGAISKLPDDILAAVQSVVSPELRQIG